MNSRKSQFIGTFGVASLFITGMCYTVNRTRLIAAGPATARSSPATFATKTDFEVQKEIVERLARLVLKQANPPSRLPLLAMSALEAQAGF